MRTTALTIVLACGLSCSVLADDPRIDDATGRDTANYPPPRHFDHLHMRLAIDIPDMDKRFLTAEQTLTVTPIGKARSQLVLNSKEVKIESVTLGGAKPRALPFTHEAGKLVINFDPPVKLGEKVDVITKYSLDTPRPSGGILGGGFNWTRGRADAKDETGKFAQIHTQGQPEYNQRWFPCHDSPNERLTTELIVTAQDPFVVSSNGKLLGTTLGTPSASGTPRMTWHWLQDKPHANYLVTLVVGRFSIVGLPAKTPEEDVVANYLYAPVGTEKNAAAVYRKTPAMIAHFGKMFDQPYPWAKYSQALCRGYMGGMENTSATTMSETSARTPPGSQDDIIAHELGHQWFGDFVTCKSWEHAWLNEGWASFCEAIWAEADAAPGKSRQAYQGTVAGFLSRQRGNRTIAPAAPAMVSKYYLDPFTNFMKANDIYSKGGCILHMLRMRLGEDAFWGGVRTYLKMYQYGSVETDNFRRCLEAASGQNLERFFAQWCDRPGMPRLDVEMEWTPLDAAAPDAKGNLKVVIKQVQKINADNPAYWLSLPIAIKTGEKVETKVLEFGTTEAWLVQTLDAKPTNVTVDPDATVMAPTAVRKPLAMWLEQMKDQSVFARLQAVDHLGLFDDPLSRQSLAEAAQNSELTILRDAARASLDALQESTAVAGGVR